MIKTLAEESDFNGISLILLSVSICFWPKEKMKEKIEKEIVFFITVFIPANRVDTNDYDDRVSAALAFSNDSIESSANIAIVASLRSM